MSKNIILLGQDFAAVPALNVPLQGGGTARFIDEDDAGGGGTEYVIQPYQLQDYGWGFRLSDENLTLSDLTDNNTIIWLEVITAITFNVWEDSNDDSDFDMQTLAVGTKIFCHRFLQDNGRYDFYFPFTDAASRSAGYGYIILYNTHPNVGDLLTSGGGGAKQTGYGVRNGEIYAESKAYVFELHILKY